jgi:hypothetical protein
MKQNYLKHQCLFKNKMFNKFMKNILLLVIYTINHNQSSCGHHMILEVG